MTVGEVPSSDYDLPPNLIRVWRVWLDYVPGHHTQFEGLLSQDEIDRARRFRFQRDRRRFTMARAALRLILSGYLNQSPKLIVFDYGPQEKPFLAAGATRIRFNVAHSAELALIAVSRERELGVDLEFVRQVNWAEQTQGQFFSSGEAALLRSLSPEDMEAAFFACWTRKEAYIKARGGGLSIPLEGFDVSFCPGQPPALLKVKDDPTEASRWGMATLDPAIGYKGALVAQGKDWQFSYGDWSWRSRP